MSEIYLAILLSLYVEFIEFSILENLARHHFTRAHTRVDQDSFSICSVLSDFFKESLKL